MIERLENLIDLIVKIEFLGDQASRALELKNRLLERELIISVIGKFKSGKSSLINALLLEDLLPVGIIPLTTVVTEIRRAKKFRAVVCFINGSEKEVKRSDLLDYISEQKNPDNEKQVSVVKLWTRSTPFESGITLVDTPGVGSVHLHNTETSHDYIEKSDAVLFLLSVDSPVSETELDFLLKTRKHAAKFYFAVNKIDTISKENLQEFLNYCKKVISEAIGLDVKLYPISTQTGVGMDSLKEKLNYDIGNSYDELLESSISIKLDTITEQTKAKVVLYLKAAKIPSQEFETKISQIKEKQLLLDKLSDEFQVLSKNQTEKLVEQIKESLEEILPGIMTDVKGKAEHLNESLKELPSKQFEAKFRSELENVLDEEIRVLNKAGLDLLQEGYGEIVDSFNLKAKDMALYISKMVMEHFGVEYLVSTKTYSVSERSDYYVRLTLYDSISSFVHLLTRSRANKKIYDRLMIKSIDNLNENKTRIIYNYRYKMRESLRGLGTEFTADIANMNGELNALLDYIEKGHNIQGEELEQVESKYMTLIEQLDGLSATIDKDTI